MLGQQPPNFKFSVEKVENSENRQNRATKSKKVENWKKIKISFDRIVFGGESHLLKCKKTLMLAQQRSVFKL